MAINNFKVLSKKKKNNKIVKYLKQIDDLAIQIFST